MNPATMSYDLSLMLTLLTWCWWCLPSLIKYLCPFCIILLGRGLPCATHPYRTRKSHQILKAGFLYNLSEIVQDFLSFFIDVSANKN